MMAVFVSLFHFVWAASIKISIPFFHCIAVIVSLDGKFRILPSIFFCATRTSLIHWEARVLRFVIVSTNVLALCWYFFMISVFFLYIIFIVSSACSLFRRSVLIIRFSPARMMFKAWVMSSLFLLRIFSRGVLSHLFMVLKAKVIIIRVTQVINIIGAVITIVAFPRQFNFTAISWVLSHFFSILSTIFQSSWMLSSCS